jgi:hypothetical protein
MTLIARCAGDGALPKQIPDLEADVAYVEIELLG